MLLTLHRKYFTERSTIGMLSVNGKTECFTLEDRVHDGPKVAGRTAIPLGTYNVIVNESQRFKRLLPLLLEVPGFEGVRIHCGNTDADTEGCILVGKRRGNDMIFESRAAFDHLFPQIAEARERNEPVSISIVGEPMIVCDPEITV
jgi:hypothetical protein